MREGTKIGECLVDSGQIMIIDPCYVDDGLDYQELIKITLDEKGYGAFEGGVVTRTLWGDGTYPVHAEFEGNRVSSLTIYFDDAPEEEEDEYENFCEKCGKDIDVWDSLCNDCDEEEEDDE